ncbi:MAG: alpha/beta hydrolase, partial [Chloroflexi bacterium]|nr:alpha/beta hydrolase [Chloroflexota bacterium]
VMLPGAFNLRATTEPLGRALADRCTIFNVDRRGRGDSGDTAPYAVEREIEDVAAVIRAAGGAAAVFGYSSGAVLALRAAAAGLPITKLALYEPPFRANDGRPAVTRGLAEDLAELITAGRRGDAVALFQRRAVGIPAEVIAQLRHAPFWPNLEAMAHTLVYEATILGDMTLPTKQLACTATRTLVIRGGQSGPFLQAATEAVASALPNAELCTLPDETHDINPETTAPAIASFLEG